MLTLQVIGIGTGDPEHMTVQGIGALNRSDIVLLPRKGADKADLADLRREICRRYLTNASSRIVEFDLPKRAADNPSYLASVDDWHTSIADRYRSLLATELPQGGIASLLIWGDPSLYDSTLRILERLRTTHRVEFALEIVPGIASPQVLAARHAIPLNSIGNPVLFTTGRKLREEGWPEGVDTLVVMLDGEMSFRTLDPDGYDIFWSAYLGLDQEISLAGSLREMADRIVEARTDARAEHGWVMDIYLLRRKPR